LFSYEFEQSIKGCKFTYNPAFETRKNCEGTPLHYSLNNKKVMKVIKQNVGIDVSKKELVICMIYLFEDLNIKIKGTRKFPNTLSGFGSLLGWVALKKDSSLDVHFTLEPTGVYHENLAYYLNENRQVVHIVLGLKAKKYAESLDTNSKTDKLDSKALARMGSERQLDVWRPSSPLFLKLKVLTRERSALIKVRVMFQNQLEGMGHSAYPNKKSMNRLKSLIKAINDQTEKIEKDIEKVSEGNIELKAKVLKVMTIPGVAFITAITIIAETDGFALIKSIKQIVAYAGLDVRIRESGKWKGKAKISKAGNVHIRKALYMPSLSSITHALTYKLFYERLRDRKGIKMIALIAVQRKILGLIYTLWKNDSVYIENHQNKNAA